MYVFYIYICIWEVVKIMVPFGVPIIIRHLVFRVPKKGQGRLSQLSYYFRPSTEHMPKA